MIIKVEIILILKKGKICSKCGLLFRETEDPSRGRVGGYRDRDHHRIRRVSVVREVSEENLEGDEDVGIQMKSARGTIKEEV